jgi:hypothetical protein
MASLFYYYQLQEVTTERHLPNFELPIAYCLLPIAHCLLPVAYCLLLIANYENHPLLICPHLSCDPIFLFQPMADSKIKTCRSPEQNVVILYHHPSHCICISNCLYIPHSARLFVDAKGLMAIFGRQ